MLFSKITNASLDAVIAQSFPATPETGTISALKGLSGTSYCFSVGASLFSARKLASCRLPGLSLQRQYRVLRRLPKGMAPAPYCLTEGWLLAHWLEGEVFATLPPLADFTELLHTLHCQPLFGWRIHLLPLLIYYWQHSDPRRRTVAWLRALRRFTESKEPHPLRLAPLHMDIHVGNLVGQDKQLGLIDWEYAGDGDIALELASVLAANAVEGGALLDQYAARAWLDPTRLRQQVACWYPWVMLLMASWYECRGHQTGEQQFMMLADDTWRRLWAMKSQGRVPWGP